MPYVSQLSAARKSLTGFFLTGFLLSVLGAILPLWGYHLEAQYLTVGNFFLAMFGGLLASSRCAHSLLRSKGIRFSLVLAASLGAVSLGLLAALPPGASVWWRMAGLALLGASVAPLAIAVLHAITPLLARDPAPTLNLGGVFFGLGSLTAALLVGAAFYVYTARSLLVLLCVIPAFATGVFAQTRFDQLPLPPVVPLRQALHDFRSPEAVLLSLLLFFQFGNEWAIAGWLPIFLIQRLGVSPELALNLLAVYWLCLIVGRIVIQAILSHVRHGRILGSSAVLALLGCAVLFFTNNVFGALMGILFLGWGFAAIYPLVAERIGHRFPYYHPGFFSGIFSLAAMGAMLAPWTLGIYSHLWGIRAVMLVPLLGSMVVVLLLLIMGVYTRLLMTGAGTRGAEH